MYNFFFFFFLLFIYIFQLFIIKANKYFVSLVLTGRIGTLSHRLFVHVGLFWLMDVLPVTLPG